MDRDSVASLLNVLAESRLVEPQELDELMHCRTRFRDAQELGRYLRERGWLTSFQLDRLFQGMGRRLLLGHYQLLEPLGGGNLAQVFKARHERLKRIVALKTLDASQFADPMVLARFHREAEVAARLAHPNIVLLYDAGQEGDTYFLAMEFVDGINLDRFVQQSGPLPTAQACDCIRQAARGLYHMHERGLVHRDIKPANLLLTQSFDRNGQPMAGSADANRSPGGSPQAPSPPPRPLVKILDMGLARFYAAAPSEGGDTTTGPQRSETLGTPDYLAPEQALNSRRADHRSDIYSLGCTFYYLLTGKPPCGEGSLAQRLMWHQSDQPPPLDEVRPGLPSTVSALLLRMLERDPERRPQSAADVAAALQPYSGPDSRCSRPAAPASMEGTIDTVPELAVPKPPANGPSPVPLRPAPSAQSTRTNRRPWIVRGIISTLIWIGVLVGVWAWPFGRPVPRDAKPTTDSPALMIGKAQQQTAYRPGDWRSLFTGVDLHGWDVAAAADGTARTNPQGPLFTAVTEEGQPALRVSGQGMGTLTTQQEFAAYHLRLEFKWGASPQREPRRGALLYHCLEPTSSDPGSLPGLEYVLEEGHCGDLVVPTGAGTTVDTTGELVRREAAERTVPVVQYQLSGRRLMIPLGVQPRILAAANPENAPGQWNSLEVLTFRTTSMHRLNGQLCVAIRDARRWQGPTSQPVHRGKIRLRAARTEIYFRNILIRPLDQLPEEFAR